jgi:hypothetical protein
MIETIDPAETRDTAEPRDDTATHDPVTIAGTPAEATATSAPVAEPLAEPESAASQPARRATKFMAELSRAMQVAAENSRLETMTRFEVEAKGVGEDVHGKATDEVADLRRKADDDVAEIREWSKAEIARIREETEARIAARKSGLDGEVERHAVMVEARIQLVAKAVAAFELSMTGFFERLNAETDPTRIATMAETMPDPPSLAEVAASMVFTPLPSEPTPDAVELTDVDFAAAEAEAFSFTDDLDGDDDEPAATASQPSSPKSNDDPATGDDKPEASTDLGSTRVIVSGLISVANIANFKRSLTRTSGISKIAVASGPDGDFIFTVGHTLGSALSASIKGLPGFDIQISGESDDAINVAAQDRDATD